MLAACQNSVRSFLSACEELHTQFFLQNQACDEMSLCLFIIAGSHGNSSQLSNQY